MVLRLHMRGYMGKEWFSGVSLAARVTCRCTALSAPLRGILR